MDKYLQQILHEINTIIIPNLGALTVTKKETGEVMFMSFLKHDDGNLSKIIAEKEGITENDAKNYIARHVREITAKLDVGESYDMFRFGRFIKKNGEIEFENWDQYQHADTEPLILTESPTIEVIEEKPVEKEIAVEEAAQPSIDEIIQKSLSVEAHTIQPDENVYIPEEELKVIEQQTEVKKVEKVKPVAAPGNDKKSNNTVKIKQKKKRGAAFWLTLLALFLVIVGGGGAYLFKDQLSDFISTQKEKIAKSDGQLLTEQEQEEIEEKVGLEAPEEETTTANEEPEETIEQASKVESTPVQSSSPEPVVDQSKAFHIIVGGFTVEENADRFAKKFRDEGKSSVVLGKFDDKFLVSYESYSSREEANEALKNMQIPAWVFKYQK